MSIIIFLNLLPLRSAVALLEGQSILHQLHRKLRDVFYVNLVYKAYFVELLHQRLILNYSKDPRSKVSTEFDVRNASYQIFDLVAEKFVEH